MITQNKNALTLAIHLTALAGFTDALGFLKLGGFFVSFMSGNSTRFAVNSASLGVLETAAVPAALITLFIIGVMAGVFARHFYRREPMMAVLGFVTVTLFAGAFLHVAGNETLTIACMVLSMGAANNVFVRDGQVDTGLTYMTGNIVKFGQKFAASILGLAAIRECLPYLLLWVGLVTGAIMGTLCYSAWGLNSLWIAAGFGAWIMALRKWSPEG